MKQILKIGFLKGTKQPQQTNELKLLDCKSNYINFKLNMKASDCK